MQETCTSLHILSDSAHKSFWFRPMTEVEGYGMKCQMKLPSDQLDVLALELECRFSFCIFAAWLLKNNDDRSMVMRRGIWVMPLVIWIDLSSLAHVGSFKSQNSVDLLGFQFSGCFVGVHIFDGRIRINWMKWTCNNHPTWTWIGLEGSITLPLNSWRRHTYRNRLGSSTPRSTDKSPKNHRSSQSSLQDEGREPKTMPRAW